MTPLIDRSPHRRGVLLLVVLSMLTLFLLLGTAYLVTSSRSRVAARAFNRLVMQSDSAMIPREKYLDETLLYVLRGGTTAPSIAGSAPLTGAASFESLLEDKYGRDMTLTGTAATVARASGTSPLLLLQQVQLGYAATSSLPLPTAPELPGRVLTLVPDDGPRSSHRIIHATGPGPFTLYVDNPARTEPSRIPTVVCPVVVNGREFDGQGTTNEGWDGFDGVNSFLAHVGPSNALISSSTVSRASYLTTIQTGSLANPAFRDSAADNDNDGQKDGAFVNFGFPGIPTASGTIDLHASVLIVDLDSRFNVNAHGSLAGWMYQASTWPTVTGTTFNDIPLGSGYGPSEVSRMWMLQLSGPTTTSSTINTLGLMTGGTSFSASRPTAFGGSRFSTSGSTPSLQSLQGRYGEAVAVGPPPTTLASAGTSTLTAFGDPMPGQVGLDDLLSKITDQRIPPSYNSQDKTWVIDTLTTPGVPALWWTGSNSFNWSNYRTSYNSPPDLHGRMKRVAVRSTTPQGIAPSVYYAKPEWGSETTDDPYEIELGHSAKVNGWMGDPNTNGIMPVYDNIYSTAELEPVLRPYDSDTFRLPLRLSATLGLFAEEARFRVTTSSWDTTAITGTAAANLQSWLRRSGSTGGFVSGTSPTSGTLGGEVLRGERFDLNRPLTSVKPPQYDPNHLYYVQRQAYFKDLYTLLCAILHPSGAIPTGKPQEYAQWAANVVEFRDADSTITPFEFDGNPVDGWGVDGDATTTNDATSASGGIVWGAERPEILIMETSAWESITASSTTGELFITLHRPWNAAALSGSGTVAAEPCDAALDVAGTGAPRNQIDLGRTSGTSSYPIWRLRISDTAAGGLSALVRLDASGTTSTDYSSTVASGTSAPRMSADSWLCIHGANSLPASITSSGTVLIDHGGGGTFRVPGTALAPLTNRRAMLYLERLTDPSANVTNAIWNSTSGTSAPHYHVVDQAPIEVVNRTPPPPPTPLPPPSKISRDDATSGQALWRCIATTGTSGTSSPPIKLGPSSFLATGSNAKWFPWPNRPFVSAAELFLVPGGDAVQMLQNYVATSSSNNFVRTMHSGTNQLLLLDAVHVPTRFAGIHRTVTSDPTGSLGNAGIFWQTTPVNQLSSFREPGRVNLNTVAADDVWNAVVAGPLSGTASSGQSAVARPLKTRTVETGSPGDRQGKTTPPNDQAPPAADLATQPAQSLSGLLALQGPGALNFAADTHPALVASGSLNPADLLYTANRLANTATIRSNVFAVWVTLRESIQNDPDSVKYHRAFYIVDRSIPVAHEAGKDHNVWDSVILRRIIE
jgi:Tfp pilus assembly protein PilX